MEHWLESWQVYLVLMYSCYPQQRTKQITIAVLNAPGYSMRCKPQCISSQLLVFFFAQGRRIRKQIPIQHFLQQLQLWTRLCPAAQPRLGDKEWMAGERVEQRLYGRTYTSITFVLNLCGGGELLPGHHWLNNNLSVWNMGQLWIHVWRWRCIICVIKHKGYKAQQLNRCSSLRNKRCRCSSLRNRDNIMGEHQRRSVDLKHIIPSNIYSKNYKW